MSDTDPFEDVVESSREERLKARLDGLIQYQEDLLDNIRRKPYSPYCHIPDLFNLDPEAQRPFSVPSSFIPEQVGGNVSVTNTNGGFLDSEPVDLMLSSFLPGGYKRRWDFDMWTGDFDPSTRQGFADLRGGLEFKAHEPLSALLPKATEESYTPFHHRVEDVGVYIPKELVVRNPSVTDDIDIAHYYWDTEQGFIYNRKPDDVPEERLTTLSSDPTSQFLWFKHLLSRNGNPVEHDLSAVTNGLFERATFDDDTSFLKCYYATLLTLYGEDRTFSEVIRYRHDEDDKTAFIGSREESQVVLFDIPKDTLSEVLDTVLNADSRLYRDLQFAMLYRHLWDRLFFQEEALSHAFSVSPFYTALVALDYSLFAAQDTPDSLFEADLSTIRDTLPTLLPGPESRLALLDYDETDIAVYANLLEENNNTLTEILDECGEMDAVRRFAEHVFVHSLKHALASWAAEFSAGGSEFEAWYDVNFQQRDTDSVQIGIYDTIQGGAGVSKEVFDDIKSLTNATLLEGIASQGCCHIAATEETIVEILGETRPELLYDRSQALRQSGDGGINEFQSVFSRLGTDHRHMEYDDVRPLLRRKLDSLTESRELARFYARVAQEYRTLRDRIGRTPHAVDVVFALEDTTFFDSRVRQTYERFTHRRSRRRDISELAERVEEITKQCVRACPDCLKRQSCTHQYRYQEQMLDRRLVARGLASLESNS
jgi:hypothetical protein